MSLLLDFSGEFDHEPSFCPRNHATRDGCHVHATLTGLLGRLSLARKHSIVQVIVRGALIYSELSFSK